MSIILDFQDWGWQVSLHRPNDLVYLEAMEELEKATRKRRRQTQLVYAPRLALEEIFGRGRRKGG
jgi:hypothetical protein